MYRCPEETNVGFTLEDNGNVVSAVDEEGAAYRAGIDVGDKIRGFNLSPLSTGDNSNKLAWNGNASMEIINACNNVITIRVKKSDDLGKTQEKRKKYITTQLVRPFAF